MASIYKPSVTRYLDNHGKQVPKGTPGASKKSAKSKVWRGRYNDASGKRCDVKLCSNKTAARQMLNEMVTRSEMEQAGLANQFEEHLKRPLTEHIAAYRRALQAKDNSTKHVNLTLGRLTTAIDACRFHRLSELSASRLADWLKEQRECGMSIRTSNDYLRCCKSFTTWLIRDRRIGESPFAHLQGLNAKLDRRLERRSLSAANLSRLLTATRYSNRTFRGLSGEDRFQLYLFTARSGFRAFELSRLTQSWLDLTGSPPSVTIQASDEKARRGATIPLPQEVADSVREWIAKKEQESHDVIPIGSTQSKRNQPLWPRTWWRKAAEMLRYDLADAGIEYEDEQGRVFDFHSLRGQYITDLGRNGVSLQEAQKLARHSDPRLTANHYTHLSVNDLSNAIEKLPDAQSAVAVQQATGTDDANFSCTLVALTGDKSCDSVTSIDKMPSQPSQAPRMQKPLEKQGFDDDCESLIANENQGAARIRTGDGGFAIRCPSDVNPSDSSGCDTSEFSVALSVASPDEKAAPELDHVIEAWPELPEHARKVILAIVDSNR